MMSSPTLLSVRPIVRRASLDASTPLALLAGLAKRRGSQDISVPRRGSVPLSESLHLHGTARRHSTAGLEPATRPATFRAPPRPMHGYIRMPEPTAVQPVAISAEARKTFLKVYNKLNAERGEPLHLPNRVIWLAGAPGAGKGTNTAYIESASGITAPTIIMSSILDSPLCQAIKAVGGMVDDSVVLEALLQEMAHPKYRHGVVIDGFPRTSVQVDFIHMMHETHSRTQGHAPDYSVAVLHVSEAESIARQMARGADLQLQNAQRILQNLPILEARPTDLDPVYAATRYSAFSRQYASLLSMKERYRFHMIDASGSREEVKDMIEGSFRRRSLLDEVARLAGTRPSTTRRERLRVATIKEDDKYADSITFYTTNQDDGLSPPFEGDFYLEGVEFGTGRQAYA